ncbi:MAG: hypothetical protein MI744_07475, partial [Pseudomonadales bacterium]|nr:hypothetical protein [Pseudomonadales bacterium]
MKKLITFLTLFTFLFSCSKEDDTEIENIFDSNKYPQKWELVRMFGQLVGSGSTGEDMERQEYYLFNADDTFLKSRERDGVRVEESGTFTFEYTQFDELMLVLKYDRDNDLIGSCYSSQVKEVLWIK